MNTTEEKLRYIVGKCEMDDQIGIAQEECAELIQALSKFRRYGASRMDSVAEEMADVIICIRELELYFGNRFSVSSWVDKKLNRSIRRIQESGKEAE